MNKKRELITNMFHLKTKKSMKKFMFLVSIAALALTSCSNEEAGQQSPQSLNANAVNLLPVVNGATRGTVYTDANLFGSFKVVMTGSFKKGPTTAAATAAAGDLVQTVTKSGSNWTMATPLYWADETTSATFTAVAGFAETTTNKLQASNAALDYTVNATAAAQEDVVVAYNSGKKTDFTAGVPLHFRHTMSQILVKASYKDDADASLLSTYASLTVKVKGMKFVNLNNKGTLTLPTASTAKGQAYEAVWSGQTGSETFTAAPASEITLGSTAAAIDNNATDGPMLLMPQSQAACTDLATGTTGAYLAVQVNIMRDGSQLYPKTDGDYDWIAVPVVIDWKPGYKYTYTLNFSNIAAGKIAPDASDLPDGKNKGDAIIDGVLSPLNFLVTVEETWGDGGETTPSL